MDLDAVRHAAAGLVDEQVEETVRFAEIPAPPFGEERRARAFLARLAEIGLDSPRLDEEGNALAVLEGPEAGPRLVVAAHLDTVFPEGTDVTVERDNGILRGPGIGDNAANLAAVLSIARILRDSGGIARGEILFAGTVGEEGLGNLRGMHRLMRDHGAATDAVVCIDGTLGSVVVRGVGSRRYRVRCEGPGGHSFGDFGRPSAVHGLSRLIARITDLEVPEEPKTTFNVGSVQGGDGITSIASRARMLLDLRSESTGAYDGPASRTDGKSQPQAFPGPAYGRHAEETGIRHGHPGQMASGGLPEGFHQEPHAPVGVRLRLSFRHAGEQ